MISYCVGHMNLMTMILMVCPIMVLVGSSHGEKVMDRVKLVQWAGYGEDKLSTVVIDGKLLCHADFNHKHSTHPIPISGAMVAVFCGSGSGKRKKSWAKQSSDSHGQFIIDLPSHLHAIPNLEKICIVKVLHLPKSSPCRHAFTGKHKAIKLASIGEGVRIYTTHNIHLMTKPPSRRHMTNGAKMQRHKSTSAL